MQSSKLKQLFKVPLLITLLTITTLSFSLDQDRYAHSQSSISNSIANATGSKVDLKDTHPSPANVKAGSKFELLSTVVNNSPHKILLPAGLCDSPLTAFFMSNNVVIKQTQGCTAKSPPFELNPGQEVTVAGPASGTIYQAIKAGKIPATATVYYLTENGQPGNVTKPFAFTIN
ncbi:MAG TPA: hypothetical protein VH481_10810 [Nitrososphaeraceae archaeon]|jgi:hypothetical protein